MLLSVAKETLNKAIDNLEYVYSGDAVERVEIKWKLREMKSLDYNFSDIENIGYLYDLEEIICKTTNPDVLQAAKSIRNYEYGKISCARKRNYAILDMCLEERVGAHMVIAYLFCLNDKGNYTIRRETTRIDIETTWVSICSKIGADKKKAYQKWQETLDLVESMKGDGVIVRMMLGLDSTF